MSTIQVETDKLLNAALQMPRSELEEFVRKLFALKAREEALDLDKAETELLVKIHDQVLPHARQVRLNDLIDKRQSCVINDEELAELIDLTNESERLNVIRLQHLIELAALRDVPLDQLMQQLGVRPTPHD